VLDEQARGEDAHLVEQAHRDRKESCETTSGGVMTAEMMKATTMK
jgi:hypothetical protein